MKDKIFCVTFAISNTAGVEIRHLGLSEGQLYEVSCAGIEPRSKNELRKLRKLKRIIDADVQGVCEARDLILDLIR